MERSSPSSASRPTIGPLSPTSAASPDPPSTAEATTDSDLPLSARSRRSPNRNPRTARRVRSAARISPGSAMVCSRAAVLTTSPVTMGSPEGASPAARTSPVLTPIRICSVSPWVASSSVLTSSSRRRMRIAARSALAGSSSWADGTPNAAITASPMNFSTVPPSASISSRMPPKKVAMTSRSCSGSMPFAQRRRPGDVGEQHAHDPSFLDRDLDRFLDRGPTGGAEASGGRQLHPAGGAHRTQARPARRAEPCLGVVLGTTCGAANHRPSLGPFRRLPP